MFVLCLGALSTLAQRNNISPYSRYGVGSLRHGKMARNYGLAGAAYALRSENHINILNPASYDTLRLTTFEAGVELNNLWLDGDGQSQFQNYNYFSHLFFGVPVIKNKWGMVFGIMPTSTIGYEYEQQFELTDEVGTVTNLFEGSGGLNQVMMGHGFRVLPSLSAGFNASYLVGKIDNKERIIYDELATSFNTRQTNKVAVGDLQLDFGLQHRARLNNGLTFRSGATFAFEQDVRARQTLLVESYTGDIGFENVRDTVQSTIDKRTSVRMPATYGLGFALEKDKSWLITLEGDFSNWSTTDFNASEPFSDAWNVRTGMEIQRSAFKKVNGRIRDNEKHYRFGFRYGSSYITIGGEPISEMAAGLGYTLYKRSKIASNETIKGLNFGMEIGMRGEDTDLLVRERFVNFLFAITINDRWFIKRKYN